MKRCSRSPRPLTLVSLVAPVALVAGSLAGCGDDQAPTTPVDAGLPVSCPLSAEVESRPGYPFGPGTFRDQVWPILAEHCAGAGCHGAPSGVAGFTVWPLSDDSCDFASTFNAVYSKTDFRNDPKNSRVYASVTGSNPNHPALPALDQAALDVILDYVTSAYDTYLADSGPIDASELFDAAAYQAEIAPALTDAGCMSGACHHPDQAAGDFSLPPDPAPDSDEMAASMAAVIKLIDFSTGQDGAPLARIYVRATDNHGGVALAAADAEALLAWIKGGLPPGDEPPPPGCSDSARFDLAVFRDELMPMLNGDIDFNDLDSGRNTTGCTRGPCHGQDRGPGSLFLSEEAPAEDNLRRFACFVDTVNPSASQILACPLGHPRCAYGDHPGDDIFSGVEDRNYQRLLSYLYSSALETSPLDFAYFVRRVNPIFNDRDSVYDGALGLSCASVGLCHGKPAPDQPPQNNSNFGIVPETTSEEALVLNFLAAASFSYFPDPTQSSLILYPTDEISNRADNPFATGIHHPGGEDFAIDDPEAKTIIEWAGGLRPDAEGFVRSWLIAGDFGATDIGDEPIADEATVEPRIFQRSGQSVQYNSGEWDGLFSDTAFIDLNDPAQGFPRDAAKDRIAYAAVWIINADSKDLEVTLRVRSPNDVKLYAGDQFNVGRDGAGTSLKVTLPSYGQSQTLTRVLVKVLQLTDGTGENRFGFDLAIEDKDGDPLTASSRQLVLKLGPEGGI